MLNSAKSLPNKLQNFFIGDYQVDLINGDIKLDQNIIMLTEIPSKEIYSLEEIKNHIHFVSTNSSKIKHKDALKRKVQGTNETFRLKTKTGKTIDLLTIGEIEYNKDAFPIKILGSTFNITEYITNKTNPLQTHNDLTHLLKAKDNSAKNLALQLKTPISELKEIIQKIKKDIPKDQESLISIQEESCEYAQQLLSKIEQFQESKSNVPAPIFELNLVSVLKKICEKSIYRAKQKGIKVVCSYEGSEVRIKTNKFILERVFNNIMSNAIKFTAPGKQIKLELTTYANQVNIVIADQGIGMPQDIQDKIFCEQSVNIKRAGTNGEKSYGFGLKICKNLLSKINGELEFESQENKGTTFTIKLPH